MSKRVLAFDFGASGGRCILAEYNNGKLDLKEISRFSNDPVRVNGTLYWDILRLFYHIKQGIQMASLSGKIDSIAVDTWGVDFGLVDEKGNLIDNPVHYRDERTLGMMEEAFKTLAKDRIYEITGIEFMELNTLYQLLALKKYRPEALEMAQSLLFTPDLFNYFLTGVQKAEYSIASTSQMLDARKREWSAEILEAFDLPSHLLKPVIPSGTIVGQLSDDICRELGIPKANVVAVASHDTQSAILAAPATDEDFIYLSSGTWSLIGTELKEPIINDKSAKYNLTNEGGFGGRIQFLKNVIGTWLLQECRRNWKLEGHDLSYDELEEMALESQPFNCFIDPSHPVFMPPGDMPGRIRDYCKRTGQYVPQTIGEIVRCIFESLAMKYREACEMLKDCTGKDYRTLHLMGGGSKSPLLCQMTASSCGIKVVAGPTEATALGNIAGQLIALGEISGIEEARRVIAQNTATKVYTPIDAQLWTGAYQQYKVLSKVL